MVYSNGFIGYNVYSKTVKPKNFTSKANMSEKFCLKWNDFQTNVSNTFRKLRTSDHFYDVTLVSDDQQQVSAHKVVLAFGFIQ